LVLVLDPNFDTNHRIFFSLSEPAGEENSNITIARAILDEQVLKLSDVAVIFRAKPAMPKQALSSNSGGRIVIAKTVPCSRSSAIGRNHRLGLLRSGSTCADDDDGFQWIGQSL
jgi:hypothetical protein